MCCLVMAASAVEPAFLLLCAALRPRIWTRSVHRVDAQVNPAVGTCLEMKEGASQPLPGLPSAHGHVRVDELLNHGVDLIWDLKQKQVSGIVGLPAHRVLDGS